MSTPTPRTGEMTPAEREVTREYFRRRRMPEMLAAAHRKVRALEMEAHRYGLPELILEARKLRGDDILTDPRLVDRAWDREVEIAYIERGGRE